MKLFGIVILFSQLAQAAEWNGGGSGFIGDRHNPWYLQNSTTVKYCIDIDEGTMGITKEVAAKYVEDGFNYWKEQFEKAVVPSFYSSPEHKNVRFHVGTQSFDLVSCTDKVDIRFQFGVLNAEQETYLKTPQKFAAVTVRTDFDLVNLRARGFVYFSPQSGRLGINKSNFLEDPWSYDNGILLYSFIVHEIGHIFGIQHNDRMFYMSEKLAEETLSISKLQLPFYLRIYREIKLHPISGFYFHQDSDILTGCEVTDIRTRKVWGVPGDHNCVATVIKHNKLFVYSTSTQPRLSEKIQYVDLSSISRNLIGTAELNRNESLGEDFVAVSLRLPVEQKVFPTFDGEANFAIMRTHKDPYFKGEYQSTDGKINRQITIHLRGLQKIIGGELDGKFFTSYGQDF